MTNSTLNDCPCGGQCKPMMRASYRCPSFGILMPAIKACECGKRFSMTEKEKNIFN